MDTNTLARSCSVLESRLSVTGRKGIINAGSESLLTAPLSESDRYVLDVNAHHSIPREKAIFTARWNWHPKGGDQTLDLGKLNILDVLRNLKTHNSGAIIDTEIHVIYLPHLPIELYRQHQLEITLDFIGTDDEDRTLSKAIFPSPLHTHVIFYPGHSFSTRRGAKYPWRLNFSTTADIREDYTIADIIIVLKGYNVPISQSSQKTGADIISLVPMENIPTGITITRPRADNEWTIKGIHYGFNNKKEMSAILCLQDAGIDIEGLHVIGMLKDAIILVNKIKMKGLSKNLNLTHEIRASLIPMLTHKLR